MSQSKVAKSEGRKLEEIAEFNVDALRANVEKDPGFTFKQLAQKMRGTIRIVVSRSIIGNYLEGHLVMRRQACVPHKDEHRK